MGDPHQAREKLISGLEPFDAWAIHDGHADFIEHPSGGPMARFFDARDPQDATFRFSQIFLMLREEGRDHQATIDKIRNELGASLPVFYFATGQVMFIGSPGWKEPASITVQRCDRLRREVEDLCVVDFAGEVRSASGEARWSRVHEDEGLSFE